MNNHTFPFDAAKDLVLERETHLTPNQLWRAWTEAELIKQWFTPKPWKTADCAMELWPGGRFMTTMEGPEGESFTGESCVLEVVPDRRLVWSSALLPGFRPKKTPSDPSEGGFVFTAVIEMEPREGGSYYRVTLIHGDKAAKNQHDGMGFQSGWGAAFDQLVDLMST